MRVKVRNGNVESALRIFKRKVTDSNVLFDYKEKQYHEKRNHKEAKRKDCRKSTEKEKEQEKNGKETLFP